MNVTRNVVLDLAPLYLTGEANEDTRALVESYLTTDPELARWMAEEHARTFAALTDVPPPGLETRTLQRARRRIATQRWLFGLGCFFLALSLSVESRLRDGRLVDVHLVAMDHPAAAAVCVIAAVACWVAYRAMRRTTF